MVESNKFDKIYCKILNIFVWSNFWVIFCKNQAVWNSDSWFDIWFLLWPVWIPKNLFKFWWLDLNLWLIKICVPFQQKLIFGQKSNFNTNYIQNSAVSRAILKPVYQLGIPNLEPQTLKGAKTNSAKNRQTTVHDQNHWQEWCFELFRMQNCQQKFFFAHGPHWGRLTVLADSPAA